MTKINEMIEEHHLDLKTMIVFKKAERTIKSSFQDTLQAHQLTQTQFAVLETLYSKGNLRIQDLIDRMLATSGNMTVVIRNMVRDGWVIKTCDPKDRRSFLIGLTPQGREKIEQVLPDHIQQTVETLSVLSPKDKEDLIRILKQFKNLSTFLAN